MRGLLSSTCWLPAAMLECHATLGSCEQEPGRAHGLCAEESVGGHNCSQADSSRDERKKVQIPRWPIVPILHLYLFCFLQAVCLVPQCEQGLLCGQP